jgi:phosphoenolpyruvate carboxykinase (GTP)
MMAAEYDEPNGVPIDAILFGGRRATTVPLVYETRDWNHGVFVGATLSSETTAAAVGAGRRRAPRPDGDAALHRLQRGRLRGHWLDIGKQADARSCRRSTRSTGSVKDEDGTFLWPGFGDNARVLKWVVERLDGTGEGVDTPVGVVPKPGSTRRVRPRHDG